MSSSDEEYTKTGKGFLTRWANRASMIPFVGGMIAWPLGMLGTVIESAQWLFRGQLGSAITTLAAGTVGNSVNALVSTSAGMLDLPSQGIKWWLGNAASGIVTGSTIGTHARAATEWAIGSVGGALGFKPQVLQAYQAGIGYIGDAAAMPQQQGPGRFASNISAERGQNANEAYARYMSGEGGAHVNELQSAHGRA